MPGRDIPLFDPVRNLGSYIDRHIFPGRLYRGVRDPVGLLSTLPALGTSIAWHVDRNVAAIPNAVPL